MHTKTMVVDDTWCMFGTANFDNRSLELNDEINVAMRNRDLARELARTFETDIASARKLTIDDWRRRGTLEKTREQFWRWFSEVF
jgi:cardiolipin synthase